MATDTNFNRKSPEFVAMIQQLKTFLGVRTKSANENLAENDWQLVFEIHLKGSSDTRRITAVIMDI